MLVKIRGWHFDGLILGDNSANQFTFTYMSRFDDLIVASELEGVLGIVQLKVCFSCVFVGAVTLEAILSQNWQDFFRKDTAGAAIS